MELIITAGLLGLTLIWLVLLTVAFYTMRHELPREVDVKLAAERDNRQGSNVALINFMNKQIEANEKHTQSLKTYGEHLMALQAGMERPAK